MIYLKSILVFFFMSCVSTYALDQPDSLSSDQLYDRADLVAVVTITSGEVNNDLYKVLGSVDSILKGISSHPELKIHFAKSVLFDSPTKLGATYLVHLKKGGDDLFLPVQHHGAMIEVLSLEKERPDIKYALKKLKLKKGNYVVYGDEIWYPELCSSADNKKLCSSYVEILEKSLR